MAERSRVFGFALLALGGVVAVASISFGQVDAATGRSVARSGLSIAVLGAAFVTGGLIADAYRDGREAGRAGRR